MSKYIVSSVCILLFATSSIATAAYSGHQNSSQQTIHPSHSSGSKPQAASPVQKRSFKSIGNQKTHKNQPPKQNHSKQGQNQRGLNKGNQAHQQKHHNQKQY